MVVGIMALGLVGCGEAKTSSGKKVDIDLSTMSGTMVYSKVYDMTRNPEAYKGKIVKMKGLFNYYKDANTGKEYFACLIQDATACCAQGIEFDLKGEHKYPDDYPEKERELTVIGEFDNYKEDGATYCIVRDAEMKK